MDFTKLKTLFQRTENNFPKNVREKIIRTITNLEKIQRKPNIDFYIIGPQKTIHAVHSPKNKGEDPIPYTKEELAELNLLESIPEIVFEKPYPDTCRFCGKILSGKQEKYCSQLYHKTLYDRYFKEAIKKINLKETKNWMFVMPSLYTITQDIEGKFHEYENEKKRIEKKDIAFFINGKRHHLTKKSRTILQ